MAALVDPPASIPDMVDSTTTTTTTTMTPTTIRLEVPRVDDAVRYTLAFSRGTDGSFVLEGNQLFYPADHDVGLLADGKTIFVNRLGERMQDGVLLPTLPPISLPKPFVIPLSTSSSAPGVPPPPAPSTPIVSFSTPTPYTMGDGGIEKFSIPGDRMQHIGTTTVSDQHTLTTTSTVSRRYTFPRDYRIDRICLDGRTGSISVIEGSSIETTSFTVEGRGHQRLVWYSPDTLEYLFVNASGRVVLDTTMGTLTANRVAFNVCGNACVRGVRVHAGSILARGLTQVEVLSKDRKKVHVQTYKPAKVSVRKSANVVPKETAPFARV